MLDPVSALGLAAGIIQLVQFGASLVNKTRDIVDAGRDCELDVLTTQSRELDKIHDRIIITLDRFERNSGTSTHPNDPDSLSAMRAISGEAIKTHQKLSALLGYLRVQPDLRRSRKRALVQAIRSQWKKDDLAKLQQELLALQQSMLLYITTALSDQSSELSRSLQEIALESTAGHKNIFDSIELLRGTCRDDHTLKDRKDIERLSRSLDSVSRQKWYKVIATCNTILSSLVFEERTWRQEAIKEAHTRTFDWMLTDPQSDFCTWTQSGGSVFWVAGKAGSGKSTLMKYINEHPRTSELLGAWAGNERVVIASHYFWYAGTRMQKSQLGLLRSILLQIVRKCPALVYTVVPKRFKETSPGEEFFPWSRAELNVTMRAIAEDKTLGTRFCFFIDGLDEYDGGHSEIIDIISCLASSPRIKICVSSRPWNVFRSAYEVPGARKIMLQDLTKNDIEGYITSTLMGNERFRQLNGPDESCKPLMLAIMKQARGVFLWVFLVVRSLLRGLTDNNDVPTLMRRLDHFPKDLDGFFEHMLESIDPVYQEHTARIFLAALRSEFRLPVSVPWHLGRELDNPDYALEAPVQALTEIEELKIKNITVYLNARCMDLLEIDNVKQHTIVFLHRTAKDYLEQEDVLTKIRQRAGSKYNITLSLARISLAEIKLMPTFARTSDLLASFLQYGRAMDVAATPKYLKLVNGLEDIGTKLLPDRMTDAHAHWTGALLDTRYPDDFADMLAFAVAADLLCYVDSVLRKRPSMLRRPSRKPLLQAALLPRVMLGNHRLMVGDTINTQGISVEMVHLLLKRGANPNERMYGGRECTLWGKFITVSIDQLSEGHEAYVAIARLMIEHGADLGHTCVVLPTSSDVDSQYVDLDQSSFWATLQSYMPMTQKQKPGTMTVWDALQRTLPAEALEEIKQSIPRTSSWWGWW